MANIPLLTILVLDVEKQRLFFHQFLGSVSLLKKALFVKSIDENIDIHSNETLS